MNVMKICPSDKCVGCGVCGLVCPKGAVALREDREGFLRPVVDVCRCVSCGACVRSCPVNRDSKEERFPVADYYGGAAKDAGEVASSTSGGMASVLARQMLRMGGVVVGAAFNPFPKVEHICIETPDGLARLKGSKYVESDITKALPQVGCYLNAGRKVLFVGLPCHVAALYGYLGGSRKGLVTCDLICHGKPPQKLFDRWALFLQRELRGEIVAYRFRDKQMCAWNDVATHLHVYRLSDGREGRVPATLNWYGRYFLGGATFRASCYHCAFARLPRVADITLADFWGAEKDSRFARFVQTGLSLVSVQSDVGRQLLAEVGEQMDLIGVTPEFARVSNKGLVCCTRRNIYRSFVFHYAYRAEWLRAFCDAVLFGTAAFIKRLLKRRIR